MSKALKKILTASSALLMVASLGAATNNTKVNARHRHSRIHRVYKRSYRHYARRHENGVKWYFHNAGHLKWRYLHKNANFDRGWDDADSVNSRNMQYGGMTEQSSNCYPQMAGNRAGRGRYGEGWITSAYYQWNDTRGHLLVSRRSNRVRNLRNIIRNYNNGIDYLQSGGSRNSQTGNIYLTKHGHWFDDNKDNY